MIFYVLKLCEQPLTNFRMGLVGLPGQHFRFWFVGGRLELFTLELTGGTNQNSCNTNEQVI